MKLEFERKENRLRINLIRHGDYKTISEIVARREGNFGVRHGAVHAIPKVTLLYKPPTMLGIQHEQRVILDCLAPEIHLFWAYKVLGGVSVGTFTGMPVRMTINEWFKLRNGFIKVWNNDIAGKDKEALFALDGKTINL